MAVQFITHRNRPARRESISQYGALPLLGTDTAEDPGAKVHAFAEMTRGFLWAVGGAAGAGIIGAGALLLGLKSKSNG